MIPTTYVICTPHMSMRVLKVQNLYGIRAEDSHHLLRSHRYLYLSHPPLSFFFLFHSLISNKWDRSNYLLGCHTFFLFNMDMACWVMRMVFIAVHHNMSLMTSNNLLGFKCCGSTDLIGAGQYKRN